ncbi:hypothetical protein [Sphingomonas sp.]
MVSVIWSVVAASNLDRIHACVAQSDPAASFRLSRGPVDAAPCFGQFPDRGCPADFGHRELVTVPPYGIPSEKAENRFFILGIRHDAQLTDD